MFLVNITECTEYDCKITPPKYLNQIKGVLYIYEYEFNEQFEDDLKGEYLLIEEVIEATFMKPKNNQATALLLTFNQSLQPIYPYRML